MKVGPWSLSSIRDALRLALPLLALAALVSPISQATLRPVYGSLPASVNHTETITELHRLAGKVGGLPPVSA